MTVWQQNCLNLTGSYIRLISLLSLQKEYVHDPPNIITSLAISFLVLLYLRLLWIDKHEIPSWAQVGCAFTTELVIVSLALKLPMRTGQRGSLQPGLELTMGRNDLATHERQWPRVEASQARLSHPEIWGTHLEFCPSHPQIQITHSLPGDR